MEATFVKDLTGFTGNAKLYRLSEPFPVPGEDFTVDHVVVSATIALFSGAETYVFPANEEGDVLDWGELEGSFRGALDHDSAIAGFCAAVGADQ